MKLLNLKTFFSILKNEKGFQRVGAIDFGTKRAGLAISSDCRNFSFPMMHIDRMPSRMSKESILAFVSTLENALIEHRIGALVVGFPVHNDRITPFCNEILQIISEASRVFNVSHVCNVYHIYMT